MHGARSAEERSVSQTERKCDVNHGGDLFDVPPSAVSW